MANEAGSRVGNPATHPYLESDMKHILGWIIAGVAGLTLLIVVAFTLELGGLQWKAFFGPKHEAVRREVFKQTRSYNEAKEQELLKYRLEYLRADEDGKRALASTIRHAFADYDDTLLTEELRRFLREIKYGN